MAAITRLTRMAKARARRAAIKAAIKAAVKRHAATVAFYKRMLKPAVWPHGMGETMRAVKQHRANPSTRAILRALRGTTRLEPVYWSPSRDAGPWSWLSTTEGPIDVSKSESLTSPKHRLMR